MGETCHKVQNIDYIIDNTFCEEAYKYPGKEYVRCYCYSGKYRDCPYNYGDDPYNCHPQTPKRRALVSKINALPNDMSKLDEAYFNKLMAEYESLEPIQRVIVKRKSKLEQYQGRIKSHHKNQKAAAKELKSQNDHTRYVIGKIDDLPQEVTLKTRKAIRGARRSYQLLDKDHRQQVTNYDRLVQAEEAVNRLVDESWDLPRTFDPASQESAKGLYQLLDLLERGLIRACSATDPRRRFVRHPYSRCRFWLILYILIGMQIPFLKVPQAVWTAYLVFAGIFFGSQLMAHIRPQWYWVRGGFWAASAIALVVLAILIATAENAVGIAITLGILTGIYPIIATALIKN